MKIELFSLRGGILSPIVLLKLLVLREEAFSFTLDFIAAFVLCDMWGQSSDSWVLQGKSL